MLTPDFVITPNALVNRAHITHVDTTRLEEGVITVHYDGSEEEVSGVMAMDLLMQLRPSALEGRRLRWVKKAWAFHNLVAHPGMQLLSFLRLYGPAMWLHDVTIPKPLE